MSNVADVVLGPRVLGGDGGRQQLEHLPISVTGQRRDSHRMETRVLARGCADTGVRVNPHDRQVLAVAPRKFGEPSWPAT